MAKKKTETPVIKDTIKEEVVETPAIDEAPKKKRGRPKKNPETVVNEVKETVDKATEKIKEEAQEASEDIKEVATETKTKAQEKADEFQEKWNSAKDLTEEFEKDDIEKNSAYAVLGYFGILVLIPIIFAPNSKYARFHANQAVILFIINAVYLLAASGIIALLALAGKAAAIIAGLIFALLSLVIFVMWAKGLSNAASGRAKKLPLIGEYEIIDVD